MPPTPSKPGVPTPDPERRKIASASFVKARQMIDAGNFDYAISMLKTCCAIDPANEEYRKLLRKTQKGKYKNNLKGSSLALFSAFKFKGRIKSAKSSRDYLKVLEHGEEILSKNPWDMPTAMDMAEAFDALGLTRLAVFSLDQTREKYPKNSTLNRAMARYCEKLGEFKLAASLWAMVLESNKNDVEAQSKANSLAAEDTIKQGGYGKFAEAGTGGQPGAAGSKPHSALADSPTDKLARDEAPIRKRLEADPTEATLYVQLVAVYRKHGAEDRARAVLQQGLGPTGNHFKLRLELMELELAPLRKSLEATDARLKKLKAGKADDETQSEEQLTTARTKLAKDVLTRETDILKLRVESFPNELAHRLELGQLLLRGGQPDEAVTVLQKVKQDERLKGKAALLLGVAFGKKGKSGWPLAQRNFEDAMRDLSPNDEANRKEVLYQFANGCATNGDLTRALELGQELANLDFGYKNISKLLDDWHEKDAK